MDIQTMNEAAVETGCTNSQEIHHYHVSPPTDILPEEARSETTSLHQKAMRRFLANALPEEGKHLPVACHATAQNYPFNMQIPQLVAQQALITPHATALVVDDQALTYGALNRRANQLAHYLRTHGVKPDVLVGLCIERSLEMVVGLLGILKAGGAYVPLDPAYPIERLMFMLKDAEAPILLTRHTLPIAAHVEASAGIQVLCLDANASLLAQQPEGNPEPVNTGDDLAYVIYTSGSTGQPKGVEITHKSLLNLICWHQQTFGVTASDRATQLAGPAFDATGWEVWPYLTCGACIYFPDEETRVTPGLLRDWLVRQDITISFLPTVLAESIIALEWPSATALRFMLTGADTLQHYPSPALPFTLINNYGPTEATVVATSGPVPTRTPAHGEAPSIGRPIANTHIYILDDDLCQVPVGVPGEIYIGGTGLARGYHKRPDLTRERFISHPLSSEPGARLYKTGDQARYLPDGQIAFIGRADQQIKIRGYRIEPGEISAVLHRQPAIQKSLVVAREDTPGDKRLVAYLVPFPEAQLSLDTLREALAAYLPDYMLPATFVLLSELPLTPNGKLDHAALPVPDATNTLLDDTQRMIAPTTPTEACVAGIVSMLLGLERVSVDDNFFMLGGHSLLGTQLIMRLSETFGVDLSLRSLFNAPTVRLLAAEVENFILIRLDAMSDDEVFRQLAEASRR